MIIVCVTTDNLCSRLMKILTETKGRRVFDAGRDRDTLYMGLVVLVDVKLDDATMGEEVSCTSTSDWLPVLYACVTLLSPL